MKNKVFLLIALFATFFPAVSYGDSPDPAKNENGLDPYAFSPLYEYEPDEDDRAESLNRIAGAIDRGYSSPEQSFKATDHYKPGPFAREASAERQDQNDY